MEVYGEIRVVCALSNSSNDLQGPRKVGSSTGHLSRASSRKIQHISPLKLITTIACVTCTAAFRSNGSTRSFVAVYFKTTDKRYNRKLQWRRLGPKVGGTGWRRKKINVPQISNFWERNVFE